MYISNTFDKFHQIFSNPGAKFRVTGSSGEKLRKKQAGSYFLTAIKM